MSAERLQPKPASLIVESVSKAADAISGANRLKPKIVDAINQLHGNGVEELSAEQIYTAMVSINPKAHVWDEAFARAIRRLEKDNIIEFSRHVYATEAIETHTNTGPRYRVVEPSKTQK